MIEKDQLLKDIREEENKLLLMFDKEWREDRGRWTTNELTAVSVAYSKLYDAIAEKLKDE